ncbi:C40 family peptidase [Clostridium aciditolerans]|uniref:C40 family peptidase n=1 Tax=Clostridium aciditolerans TaxID=339861 RepID=A0A934HQW8_9CLOT|nr:C40 family peptidase [Clostridium aciditolerans]
MNKLLKFAVATCTGVLMFSSTVLANPAANNNQTSTNESIERKIEMLDNQIEDAMSKIESNKKELNSTQSQIKNLQKEVSDTEKDIALREDIFKQRARAAYISGVDSYLDIILNSKDIQDFVWRMEAVKKIMQFDNKVMADLGSKKEKMLADQKELKDKNDKLLALKSDNEKKLSKLKIDKEDQKKMLAQAKASERNYALASTSGTSSLSRGSVSISAGSNSDVVSYAYNFLGTPYLWGGTSPSGFDCSGFTQYVYAHFGVGLGRTTYEQINDGSPVSRDQLQPGDLVLFGSSSNPHHIGIYVGNGMYIHAPHTGDVVKVSPLNRGDFLTGRRVK